MSLVTLHKDILNYWVLPSLTVQEAHHLSLVSKDVRANIRAAADALQPNVKLSGERVSISLVFPSISALLRQKMMIEVLANNHQIYGFLETIRKDVIAAKGDPDDIGAIIKYANDTYHWDQVGSLWWLIPFDYQTKQIEAKYLERLLGAAVRENCLKRLRLVLSHPHADQLSADGTFGFGACVHIALQKKKPEMAHKLLSCPHAQMIPAGTVRGIAQALMKAIKANYPTVVLSLLALPNARDTTEMGASIEAALDYACKTENQDIYVACNSLLDTSPPTQR